MTKQAEREYPLKVDQEFLYTKPYNDPRSLREFSLAVQLFQQHLPGGRILDLGCGSGWTSLMLARAGYEVTGVDISERMIEIARERSLLENVAVKFHVADMEELELAQKDFDGVFLFDCLHHCPEYEAVLQRAYEHLRPGGHSLLFETTLLHRFSRDARTTARTFGVTELGFSRRQLRRSLRSAGFQTIKQFFDPGGSFGGIGGFVRANLRLWGCYLWYFPRAKNIFLARK